MASIKLLNGVTILIDDTDLPLVSRYKWFATKRKRTRTQYSITGYKIGESSEGRYKALSRLIMHCPDDMVVDHIDGNTLDNRKRNLRICTNRENRCNTHYKKRRVKGAYYDSIRRKWRALITVHGKAIHLGRYATQKDAGRAYDTAAIRYFGAFARPNCPACAAHGYDSPAGYYKLVKLWSGKKIIEKYSTQ